MQKYIAHNKDNPNVRVVVRASTMKQAVLAARNVLTTNKATDKVELVFLYDDEKED